MRASRARQRIQARARRGSALRSILLLIGVALIGGLLTIAAITYFFGPDDGTADNGEFIAAATPESTAAVAPDFDLGEASASAPTRTLMPVPPGEPGSGSVTTPLSPPDGSAAGAQGPGLEPTLSAGPGDPTGTPDLSLPLSQSTGPTPLPGLPAEGAAASPTPEIGAAPTLPPLNAPVGQIQAEIVTTGQNANIRAAPVDGVIITTLPSETEVILDGRLADSSWVRVVLDDTRRGWISAVLIRVAGTTAIDQLPVVEP
jgi:hypothetical protein